MRKCDSYIYFVLFNACILNSSIFEPNPVVFLEHRWLHNSIGSVPGNFYKIPLGKAKIVKKGKHLSIIASSYMVADAINFIDKFNKIYSKISIELIDIRSVKPLDKVFVTSSIWFSRTLSSNKWNKAGVQIHNSRHLQMPFFLLQLLL